MQKIILVTGATDGIGKKTAERLLKQGHHVIIHGRNPDRVLGAVNELTITSKGLGKIDSSVFDLSSFASIRKGAEDLSSRFSRLDVLLNNAGTYQTQRNESVDGFELTMAINHLGPTLLTFLLKPLLKKSNQPRVIFVSSIAHNRGKLEAGNFNFESKFDAYAAYATSKLGNVITAKKLSIEWDADQVPFYSLHPGVITTKLLRLGFNVDGDTVEKGSDTSVYLATEVIDKGLNGSYFVDGDSHPASAKSNEAIVELFWQWTLSSLGLK